jgi:hypothetical protein
LKFEVRKFKVTFIFQKAIGLGDFRRSHSRSIVTFMGRATMMFGEAVHVLIMKVAPTKRSKRDFKQLRRACRLEGLFTIGVSRHGVLAAIDREPPTQHIERIMCLPIKHLILSDFPDPIR